MTFENDWRNRGQLEYLKYAKLKYVKYENICNPQDHYHCDFCLDKMSALSDTLEDGFFTKNGLYICSNCYKELKDIFAWTEE